MHVSTIDLAIKTQLIYNIQIFKRGSGFPNQVYSILFNSIGSILSNSHAKLDLSENLDSKGGKENAMFKRNL